MDFQEEIKRAHTITQIYKDCNHVTALMYSCNSKCVRCVATPSPPQAFQHKLTKTALFGSGFRGGIFIPGNLALIYVLGGGECVIRAASFQFTTDLLLARTEITRILNDNFEYIKTYKCVRNKSSGISKKKIMYFNVL